jgi:hypothetical protein
MLDEPEDEDKTGPTANLWHVENSSSVGSATDSIERYI